MTTTEIKALIDKNKALTEENNNLKSIIQLADEECEILIATIGENNALKMSISNAYKLILTTLRISPSDRMFTK